MAVSSQPMVLTMGLSVATCTRTKNNFHSGMPLACAAVTYSLFFSSSSVARMVRISKAVPANPNTSAGMHRCRNKSRKLAPTPGRLGVCG